MPQPIIPTVTITLTSKVNQIGSLLASGWVSLNPCAATMPTTPATAIGRMLRRVARETAARVAGPAAMPDTMPSAAVAIATGSGQRRRNMTRT